MDGQSLGDTRRGLWFNLTVDAAHDLARDTDRVGALLTVEATQSEGSPAAVAGIAEILIMDRSQSMIREGKLQQAKRAVEAAIDTLVDDTYFAVIAGNHTAEQVFPGGGGLERASARAKLSAKVQVSNVGAVGGTAMGTWLTLADQLFGQVPGSVRHAVLYTDGINEHETAAELESTLSGCRDRFMCDVRGVGVDWEQRELQRIADALQGKVGAITDIADLRADFTSLMEHAQRRLVPETYLRLTLDRRFRLEEVRQIRPTENDLTSHGIPEDGGVVDIPLLAWGEETRDYRVVLRFEPGTLPYGDRVRAARVDMVTGRDATESSALCATPVAVTVRRQPYRGPGPVSLSVTRAEDLTSLSIATQDGIDALRRGDRGSAVFALTTAVGIARRLGASEHMDRLLRLVTVDEHGQVRLRPDISDADMLVTETGSVHHQGVPLRPQQISGPRPEQEPAAQGLAGQVQAEQARLEPLAEPRLVSRVCPRGHVTVAPVVKYCEEQDCDHDFTRDPDPGLPPA